MPANSISSSTKTVAIRVETVSVGAKTIVFRVHTASATSHDVGVFFYRKYLRISSIRKALLSEREALPNVTEPFRCGLMAKSEHNACHSRTFMLVVLGITSNVQFAVCMSCSWLTEAVQFRRA